VAGVVAFGADAQVCAFFERESRTRPVTCHAAVREYQHGGGNTIGSGSISGDAARRMVILSDGQPTMGNTEAAAQLASAAGVEISYVAYSHLPEPEIQVRDVVAPTVLDENQEFDLTVTIASEQDTRAIVTVFAAGEIVSRQEADLRAGINNYTLRLRSGTAGFRDFLVQVDPLGDDGFYQNNRLGAFSRVEGTPRVLVVGEADIFGDGGQQDVTQHVAPALRESGLEVDIITPSELPISLTGLAQYESVVLVNVSAVNLSNQRMNLLKSYVSDLGGD